MRKITLHKRKRSEGRDQLTSICVKGAQNAQGNKRNNHDEGKITVRGKDISPGQQQGVEVGKFIIGDDGVQAKLQLQV